MIVLIAGATGFLGSALGIALVRAGHTVRVLSRGRAADLPFPATVFAWIDGGAGPSVPSEALDGTTAIVNLAGESIADGRWTAARKARIVRSRTETAAALTRALKAQHPSARPHVLVQSSATGYYGDRGEEALDESSAPGTGFLADVCRQWEAAAAPVDGVRQVLLRTSMVLGLEGGALPKLLDLYGKGLGANLGAGDHWVPFIHQDDWVRLVLAALSDDRMSGAVNATGPTPCRYRDVHHAILAARGGGLDIAAPRLAVRLALGEQATMVLESAQVLPRKALSHGFTFQYPTVDAALKAELARLADPKASYLAARQFVPQAVDKVWPFFADERNLERLTPPWLSFKVTGKSTDGLAAGTLIDYRLKLHGVPLRWRTRIDQWAAYERFVDVQLRGPYALWHHTHLFEALAGGTVMTDLVNFRLPLAPFGGLVAGAYVAHDVGKIFAFRRSTVAALFGSDAAASPL